MTPDDAPWSDGSPGGDGRDEGTVEGTVEAQLPSGLYRVNVEGRWRVTAHAGGGPTQNFIRLVVGDRVIVELSPRDRTRGRIVSTL